MVCLPTADASWWIDLKRFSLSAHAEIACTECHADITTRRFHPDPDHVNCRLVDFFNKETCAECHLETMDKLAQGRHGEESVSNPEDRFNCIQCHDPHYLAVTDQDLADAADPPAGMELAGLDQSCLDCHRRIDSKDPQRAPKIAAFCFHCHAGQATPGGSLVPAAFPRIDRADYARTAHVGIECTACHPQAASFGHASQRPGNCRQCHPVHAEKIAHDAHVRVACQSCHLQGVAPLTDPENQMIVWQRSALPHNVSPIHQMRRMQETADCRLCHHFGNSIGAAAMVLPAKSILCMPCHAATFSVGDATTLTGLLIWLGGMFLVGMVWLSGGPSKGLRTSAPSRCKRLAATDDPPRRQQWLVILKSMCLDVLLQRRLFQRSFKRWFIHGLIFFPFVIRFGWGTAALLGSLWFPEQVATWGLLDKNHALSALVFDVTGVLILTGVIAAFRRGQTGDHDRLQGVPPQDRWALGIIAGIVVIGFGLEGIRIAMTGTPENAAFAFVGYALSLMFTGLTRLTDIYAYIWYSHTILCAIFIAYLPFSRLMHIIVAPVVIMRNAFEHHSGSVPEKRSESHGKKIRL